MPTDANGRRSDAETTMRADGIEAGMMYGTDYVVFAGDVILGPTRAEAGCELSRRAIEMLREGRVTTMRAALTAAMDDDPVLKKIYAEGA